MNWLKQHQCQINLFLILLICYGYFFPRWADWSANSRLDLVLAIVDQRTFRIDLYHENTGDKAIFEGHYYTDKSIGPSLVAIPVYQVFKILAGTPPFAKAMSAAGGNEALDDTLKKDGTGLLPEKVYFATALFFVTFFTVSIPSAILAVFLYDFLKYFSFRESHRLLLTFAYGLGTNAFPYSGNFYQQQLSAGATFIAFYLLYRMKRAELNWRYLGLVGFLFSLALISEYPIVLVLFILLIYTIYVLPDKRRLLWMFLGGTPLTLVMAIYNYICFRTPLPVGYLYSPNYTEWHHTGLVSLTYPKLDGLWGITFSPYRGLFFLSPFLLFALPGFFYFWRARDHRAEFFVSLASVVCFFLYNASSIMWWGGYAVGPRYLVPILPFLTLPIIFMFAHWDKPLVRTAILFLIGVSVVLVWVETISGQSFPDFTRNPLFDYSLPRLMAGDVARNIGMLLHLPSWYSLIPLGIFIAFINLLTWISLKTKHQRTIESSLAEGGSL